MSTGPDDGGGERIEVSRPAALAGTEILIAERSARRWRVFHETYAVCAILESSRAAEWRYRGTLEQSRPGDLMLIEPGEVHANTHVTAATDFRAIFLGPALVEEAATELGMRHRFPHLRVANTGDPVLFAAFTGLHRSLESDATDLERQVRLATCVRLLLDGYTEREALAPRAPARASVLRARDYIEAHWTESLALADVVAAAGVSRFHLVRAFAREFGMPPHAYQIAVRVARAQDLLARGVHAGDVAAAVGFADQSHFTRHFKRILGVTPGAYARMR